MMRGIMSNLEEFQEVIIASEGVFCSEEKGIRLDGFVKRNCTVPHWLHCTTHSHIYSSRDLARFAQVHNGIPLSSHTGYLCERSRRRTSIRNAQRADIHADRHLAGIRGFSSGLLDHLEACTRRAPPASCCDAGRTHKRVVLRQRERLEPVKLVFSGSVISNRATLPAHGNLGLEAWGGWGVCRGRGPGC